MTANPTLTLIGTIEHNDRPNERVAILFDPAAGELVSIDEQGNEERGFHRVESAKQARRDFRDLWGTTLTGAWRPLDYRTWRDPRHQATMDRRVLEVAEKAAGIERTTSPFEAAVATNVALHLAEEDIWRVVRAAHRPGRLRLNDEREIPAALHEVARLLKEAQNASWQHLKGLMPEEAAPTYDPVGSALQEARGRRERAELGILLLDEREAVLAESDDD